MSGAVPPPAARPLERAARVPPPVCPGCGRCGRVDPAPAPQRAPLRAGVARCGGGGRASPGGGSFDRCEGLLVSGAVPPPAARPLERAAWVPPPVCPGCGGCGRVDPAPAPQRAPLRAGVARCGGGGRASPGGVPSTVVRGAWCQALSLPRPPVLWSGQPGFRHPCVPGAVDAGVWTQHRPHSVRPCGPALLAVGVAGGRPRGGVPSTVVRGAWCQALSPPRPPVLWSGQPRFRHPCVPGAVDAGVWTLHRPHSVRPCGTALLAVGVAGGRPRGGVPSTVVRGAWCQALSLPRPPVLWSGQPGFRGACVFVCVLWCGRVLVRLTFSFGRFVFLLCLAPSGLGLPPSLSLPLPFLVALALCFGSLSRPPAAWLFVRSRLVCVSCLAVGCSLVVSPPNSSLFVSRCFGHLFLGSLVLLFFFFFFFLPCALPSSPAFSCFRPRVPWASALCVFSSVGLLPLGSPCACPSFVLSARLVVAPCRLLPPPPPSLSHGFRRCRPVLCAVCCVVLCVPGCGAAPRCCALCSPVLCCSVLCCAPWVPLLVVPCPLALPVALGPCALRRCVLRCSPVLCVFCRGAVVRAVVHRSALCCVCPGVLCCAFPVLSALCGAVLPCAGALALCCSCGARCCWRLVLWCAVVRCWVCWPVVVCWWRVSVSVSLSGRVVCFPAVGVVCCGALLSCVVFCGAALLCSAVVLRCCWGLLCPPVGCLAVLCCAVGWLCFFLPGGGGCVLWCSSPRAVRSLSSPLCALRCLVALAVVPCFPVSCAVALCRRVVLCCRALLSFCGAVCVCFALLRPVVRCQCRLRCCWCLVLWRVPVRCGVSLGVLRCGGAALVCRGVLLCCALSCGVLRPVPCPAVPCRLAWFVSCVGVVVPT